MCKAKRLEYPGFWKSCFFDRFHAFSKKRISDFEKPGSFDKSKRCTGRVGEISLSPPSEHTQTTQFCKKNRDLS